ncbi:S8 family serine peptidase [Streptacidiphilus sp. P02-A3a]|uniref:S8 family serine peptidase n=1 Tax=Streptacidiphilus sp. P02-A3a TaxID=2704468 RepID=UPI0015FB9E45|nr:S8 family serine peptidase [Streptacidiphilus sp. P02-A3a]QMU72392.1 S8 family serine peptidase [Streptacidiphilus sp. P02-A3a]
MENQRMRCVRTWRFAGAMATLGVLLTAMAPAAHADAARNKQWPLQAYGAAQKIWPVTTGKGQVVAVIDTGFRTTHVDLTGQFLPGKDFAPASYDEAANAGHGTMMASLIAGHGHGPGDSDGIRGLAPGVTLLPLVVDLQDANYDQEIAGAIRYAVSRGVGVINMSIAGVTPSAIEQSAVAYAEAHNVVLVAAAGNDGAEVSNYPASFPGVVDVGGANQDGSIWSGSDYGPHIVLTGPGSNVLGDDSGTDTQYALGNGTSGATAYVSAIAALVRARFPGLTAGQVINRLIKSAIDPDAKPGQTTPDPHYGYGVARPREALTDSIPAGPAQGPLARATDPLAPVPTLAVSADRRKPGHLGVWVLPVGALLSVGCIGLGLALLRRHRRRV